MAHTDAATRAAAMTDPAEWLYTLGMPRYHADAFAAYYQDHCTGMEFSTAKRQFDYDHRATNYLARYGRRITTFSRPRGASDPGTTARRSD
ncbi:hypothetical protein K1T35_48600 (plasmid) [Pseudonocardia sp. DSM 110487]|uniref:hypothetical protein n=1 Tax=Pseudonocardia sp. DSM 110487 TaxID=2865833 RepID=UPI001C6962C0|nr:hypothetical protein [Pseudonocardia sp. DSM 110487]QYN41209.1 hypothetical protein K1T35_48600 [Pseudonocardia sp. DSM 110487]